MRRFDGEPGLARATDANQGDQPVVGELVGQLRQLAVAADEAGHLDGQVSRALTGYPQRRKLARAHLQNPFGHGEALQPVDAEIEKLLLGREGGRRRGHENLSTVTGVHHTRRAVHRRAEVVGVAQLGLTRVDADPHR